jgi:phosphonate transport system permease protein
MKNPNTQAVRSLYLARPKSTFLRLSILFLFMLLAAPWIGVVDELRTLAFQSRIENVHRFLFELMPYPLQQHGFDSGRLVSWCLEKLQERGFQAMLVTLAISIAAIVIAGVLGLLLAPFAARSLMCREPYLGAAHGGLCWRVSATVTRAWCIAVRAIPEYVWAFIFLSVFGPTAWAAVLALGIHNAGVLGRLYAETIDNLPAQPLRALRMIGASRAQIAVCGMYPLSLSRFLLYFFARWEMCVRESTALGLLGIVSLGYWIQDARARNFYDEMFFFVLLGAVLVLVGDLISALAREYIRRQVSSEMKQVYSCFNRPR